MILKVGLIDFVRPWEDPLHEGAAAAGSMIPHGHPIPRSFRVGTGQLEASLDHIPADTLFSGLCHAWRDCHGEEDEEKGLKAFLQNFSWMDPHTNVLTKNLNNLQFPPLRMSSAFPRLVNRKVSRLFPTYYLPTPASPIPGSMAGGKSRRAFQRSGKSLQAIRYLPFDNCLEFWLRHGHEESVDTYDLEKKFYKESRESWQKLRLSLEVDFSQKVCIKASGEDERELFTVATVALMTDSRPLEPGESIFLKQTNELEYRTDYYFYVLIADQWLPPFERALSRLGERGLGGKRSGSLGSFSFRWLEDTLMPRKPEVCTAGTLPEGWHYLLAPYYPSADLATAQQCCKSYFNLANKGGWSEDVIRRPGLRFFDSGSIVWLNPMSGYLVDMQPRSAGLSEPIFRFSAPLSVYLGSGTSPQFE